MSWWQRLDAVYCVEIILLPALNFFKSEHFLLKQSEDFHILLLHLKATKNFCKVLIVDNRRIIID